MHLASPKTRTQVSVRSRFDCGQRPQQRGSLWNFDINGWHRKRSIGLSSLLRVALEFTEVGECSRFCDSHSNDTVISRMFDVFGAFECQRLQIASFVSRIRYSKPMMQRASVTMPLLLGAKCSWRSMINHGDLMYFLQS